MGSPRRSSRDQERKVDIKDRLQALAKPFAGDSKKISGSARDVPTMKSKSSVQSGKERGRNEKLSSRKESIERVMERARTEGGTRWTKKLLDEEAKDPDRWGHSGFKEMYKNELGMSKNRRSRSRDKTSVHHSRSRERVLKVESMRTSSNRDKSSGGGQRTNNNSRKRRSRSSSDRSITDANRRTEPGRISGNGASHERKSLSRKDSKGIASRLGRQDSAKKLDEPRREINSKKERMTKKRSPLESRSRSRSPIRHSDKNNSSSKRQLVNNKVKLTRRGPVSPPERRRSYSRSQSRSTASPVLRRRDRLSDEASSRSSSSVSHSTFSRSSSSSSSSSESSTSLSSRETSARKRTSLKPRSPPAPSRVRVREQIKPSHETHMAKPNPVTKTAKRPLSANKTHSMKKRRTHSDTDSSSANGSSSDTEDEEDEDCNLLEKDQLDGPSSTRETKSGSSAPRLSLSERFGKLAQLSSQRRSLELVQLRIVAPVGGASATEKNVSIDESSAAPVISNATTQRERSNEPAMTPVVHHHQQPHHHTTSNLISPEEPVRKDERAREDRWRDWHERYDQYRHVQPPRQLPRDWDDIRVRHKYYTDRGYFGHDMTLEELSRWEAWWHRYQQWRRGYEHAWVKTHGPHVPVEYPDWTHYRSTNSRGEIAQIGSTMPSSIRSRLGWRR